MANKVRLACSFLDLDVTVTTAVSEDDEDTKLATVCIGKSAKDGQPAVAHDPVRIKQTVACTDPACLKEGTSHWAFPDKAHVRDDGTMKVLTPEDLAAAAPGHDLTHHIELTSSAADEVERRTLPFGKFYYLAPGKDAGHAGKYDGFARLISEGAANNIAYCTRFAIRSKPVMYRLGVIDGCITIAELAHPDQIKARPSIDLPKISDEDMEMLRQMAKRVHVTFNPADFADTRKLAIAAALGKAETVTAGKGDLATVTTITSPFALAAAAAEAADAVKAKPAKKAPAKRAPRKAAAPRKTA